MNRKETFLAKVVGNSLGISKEKKTPSVKLKFETINNITNPSDETMYKMYGNLWLSFKPAEKSIKTLQQVFGWKGKLIKELNDPILVGKICEIVVEWSDDFDGTERASIQFFNIPGGVKPLDENELKTVVVDVQDTLDKILGNSATNPSSGFKQSDFKQPDSNQQSIEEDLPF